MSRSRQTTLDRAAAPAVLALLFGGIGALGWLFGHVLTYDATGHDHAHAEHGYMQPLEQGGSLLALVGIALAVVAVAFGRHAVARWLEHWRLVGSITPWIAAATVPAATFVLVEAVEGSIATRGIALLAVGLPLQALIGCLVLALVRSLLTVLVRVADHIAKLRHAPALRGARATARPIVRIPRRRSAPMATNAALRAPPRRLP